MRILSATMFFLLLNARLAAQETDLPSGIPETEGVSSEGILNFLNAAGKSKTEFHSFMMLRHGKVVAKTWWKPYRADLRHTMYSCSKSFTATAIGFAVTEKRLSVNDKVLSFFPGDLPDSVSGFLSGLTVKDVLSMSDGQEPDPTFTVVGRDSNWVRSFLAIPVKYKPGTKFLYNTLGTYILSAIVQKVTGEKLIDYLTPRLFEPLGITGMDWEVDPRGINVGGWGLRIKTEDMAKFGQLFLQRGKWNGRQIIPSAWVEEASALKIVQHPEYTKAKRDSSDWEQGYGYQMWRSRHNTYRGDGAFGQFILIMPAEDVVIAITAETPDMQSEINLVWQYLLPAIHKNRLPVKQRITAMLNQKLSSLALPLPLKSSIGNVSRLSGKTFVLEPNEKHLESLTFRFGDKVCNLEIKTDTALYPLSFGEGLWQNSETKKPGPSLVAGAKTNLSALWPFKIAAVFNWKDDHTLTLILRYIESPHSEKIICHFGDSSISVDVENSFDYGTKKTTLKGRLQE